MIKKTWICDKENLVVSSPFIDVLMRDCHSDIDGRRHTFFALKFPNWCNIIPVTEDGKVVMVRQYRIGVEQDTLEIPGGVVDTEDKDLAATALRELAEETGYEPVPGAKCEKLGWTFPNPAIQGNECHAFIIGPVRKTREQKLDNGEMIDTVEMPISELTRAITSGEITHALILNAFLFLLLRDGESENKLEEGLRRFSIIDV